MGHLPNLELMRVAVNNIEQVRSTLLHATDAMLRELASDLHSVLSLLSCLIGLFDLCYSAAKLHSVAQRCHHQLMLAVCDRYQQSLAA